jgi:hypothetical protein
MTEPRTGDLAVRTDTSTEVATAISGNALVDWAASARAAHGIAQSLAATPFVPDSFGKNPALVTAAILVGQEVGLQPMAALRSMDIVKGTPALRAHAMRGLVQSHGHEVWSVEKTETRVVMRGQRKGSDKVEESVWTMDRARKLGVAGGVNYTKQPMTMLIARATSEICRLIAADVLLGIPYSVEELADDADLGPGTDAPTMKPTRRTAQRRPMAAVPAPPEPTLDNEPAAVPTEVAVADPAEPTLDADWPETKQPGGAA